MLRRELPGRTRLIVLSAVQGVTLALLAGRPLLAQTCDAARGAAPASLPARSLQPPLFGYPPTCAARPFALTAVEAGATAVALHWPAVPGAATYTVSWGYADPAPAPIRLGESSGGVAPPLRLLSRNALDRVAGPFAVTELTIAGLDAGSNYRWAVQALGADGTPVAESEPVTLALPAVPPARLAATVEGSDVALSWSPVPEAATYRLLAASGQGPLIADPERANLTATDTRVSALPPGAYSFQVEARDAAGGYVTRSNVAQARVGPAAPGPSEAPPELSPTAAPSTVVPSFPLTVRRKDSQTVELSWPMLWGAGSFAVYQAQGTTPLALAFTTGMHSTTLTGLASGVEYTLQVRARNVADVEFAISNPVNVAPDQ